MLIRPQVDWDAVGEALELSRGAVNKRWSRLKKAMEKEEAPSGSTYPFLWLCVKHSIRDKVSILPPQTKHTTNTRTVSRLGCDCSKIRHHVRSS